MRHIAFACLALVAPPAFASEWVLIAGEDAKPEPFAFVRYVDTASLARDGAQLEFEFATLTRAREPDYRPHAGIQRYRIDCDWGTNQSAYSRPLAPASTAPAAPSAAATPAWSRPAFDTIFGLGHIAAALCADQPLSGPAISGEPAMLDDAARRLGYADAAAAFALPLDPPVVRPAPPPAPSPRQPEQGYHLLHATPEGRAIALAPSTVKRDGALISGAAFWIIGAGQPTDQRSVGYRLFAADCAAGAIALQTVGASPGWPIVPSAAAQAAGAGTPRAPAAGSPAAILLQALCSGAAPQKQLASARELAAWIDNPAEDPAFHARRQTVIEARDMRWQSMPSAADITAALPPGALKPDEFGQTTIQCVVTRAYTLDACKITYNDPHDRLLGEAHLSVASKYIPARRLPNGEDSVGRSVQMRARWLPDRAFALPPSINPNEMRWRRVASKQEIEQVYKLRQPAEAVLECTITSEHRLTDCVVPLNYSNRSIRTGGPGSPESNPNRALGDALLALTSKYEAHATTTAGESTAGLRVNFRVKWP